MSNLILVKNDLFDISNRIKQVDSSYFVVYNTFLKRYEVHSKNQKGSTFAFCVDGFLNSNTIKKAYKTSVKFANKNIKEMFENNKKLFDLEQQNIKEKNIELLNSYLQYANNKNCNCDFTQFNKTKWL